MSNSFWSKSFFLTSIGNVDLDFIKRIEKYKIEELGKYIYFKDFDKKINIKTEKYFK